MTRSWDEDKQWRMFCDEIGCKTRSEQFPKEPPLQTFMDRGWFIGQKFGDICPACLERGARPGPNTKPYRGVMPPVMAEKTRPSDMKTVTGELK